MLKKLSCSLLALSLTFGLATTPALVSANSGKVSQGYGETSQGYDKGSVRVNGEIIPELLNVIIDEMVNLDAIEVVGGHAVSGWFYDAELTQEITGSRYFVITTEAIENGIYAQLGVVVKDEATTPNITPDGSNNAPTVVPSTGVAVLGQLF